MYLKNVSTEQINEDLVDTLKKMHIGASILNVKEQDKSRQMLFVAAVSGKMVNTLWSRDLVSRYVVDYCIACHSKNLLIILYAQCRKNEHWLGAQEILMIIIQ